jgi:hypothetical protein
MLYATFANNSNDQPLFVNDQFPSARINQPLVNKTLLIVKIWPTNINKHDSIGNVFHSHSPLEEILAPIAQRQSG